MTRVECFGTSLSRVPSDKSHDCGGSSVVEEAVEDAVFVDPNLCLGVDGRLLSGCSRLRLNRLRLGDVDVLRTVLPDAAS